MLIDYVHINHDDSFDSNGIIFSSNAGGMRIINKIKLIKNFIGNDWEFYYLHLLNGISRYGVK